MVVNGSYRTEVEAPPETGRLTFWGEWEGDSRARPLEHGESGVQTGSMSLCSGALPRMPIPRRTQIPSFSGIGFSSRFAGKAHRLR